MTAPTSKLMLCADIPFCNNYKDILLFSNETEKYNYFSSKAKFPVTNDFTYIRNQQGTPIRIEINADLLRDCNYIAYQNSAYGNKWFYAFITSVEYINDGCSFIFFEQDIWQTWGLQSDIKPSFVEREHTNDDTIGANTLPENVELGPYITLEENNWLTDDLHIYMFATEQGTAGAWVAPSILGGVPISCYLAEYGTISTAALSLLKTDIDYFTTEQKADSIISIFTAPQSLVNTETASTTGKVVAAPTKKLALTPKNNKLFTYPYTLLNMVADGQTTEIRYELFQGSPKFKINASFGVNSQVTLTPINYAGMKVATPYQQILKSFPTLPWTIDSWQNWIAQNKSQLVTQVVTAGVLAVATGGASLALSSVALAGAASQIGGAVGQIYKAANMPDEMKGNACAGDVNSYRGMSGFRLMSRSIKLEYAKVIDDYFSMFGYKTNLLKQPNLTGRRSWNFVKTISSTVRGKIPQEVARQLENILDTGVTFWHTTDVGNYSLDNSII